MKIAETFIKQATLDRLRTDPTSKILIVGGRAGNFDSWIEKDKTFRGRIIFWMEPKEGHMVAVPECTALAILMTQFISHKIQWRLEKGCPDEIEIMKFRNGTGQLGAMIEKILAPEETREDPKKHLKLARGTVQKFLLDNLQWDTQDVPKEVARLCVLALERGIATTEDYLLHRTYHLLREKRKQPNITTWEKLPSPMPEVAALPTPEPEREDQGRALQAIAKLELRGTKMLEDWEALLQVMLAEVRIVKAEYEMLKNIAVPGTVVRR